jgi:hypothetical protein
MTVPAVCPDREWGRDFGEGRHHYMSKTYELLNILYNYRRYQE